MMVLCERYQTQSPSAWALEALRADGDWDVLDEKASQSMSSSSVRFSLSKPRCSSAFRLVVRANCGWNGASNIELAITEFSMYGRHGPCMEQQVPLTAGQSVLTWHGQYSPANYAGATAFCNNKGGRLATLAEYCSSNSKVLGGQWDGDQWAPYAGDRSAAVVITSNT